MQDNPLLNKKVIIPILIVFVGLLVFGIFWVNKVHTINDILKTKNKVEKNLEKINSIIEKTKETTVKLDSTENEIIRELKEYREFLQTNHYEEDSIYVYINNVHIDSILAKLPRLNEKQ